MATPFYAAAGSPASLTTLDSGVVPNNYPDGQTLDNTVIGGITPVAATVTNLTITGTLTRTGGSVTPPIQVTTATLTLVQATHSGRLLVQNRAAGTTFTLPASTGTGATYHIFVETTITSGGVIVNTAGTDIFAGGISVAKTSDGSDFNGNSTANKTFTLNGTTTGGIAGSFVEVQDVATGIWSVQGYAPASGTLATPFSN